METLGLDIKIFGQHAKRVLKIDLIGDKCYKVQMCGIAFKVKRGRFVGLEQIKTNKGLYNVGQFNQVLDNHFLTELEIIEKAVKAVDWQYHLIDDGKTYKKAAAYFNHVLSLVNNATDKKGAEEIWSKYKN